MARHFVQRPEIRTALEHHYDLGANPVLVSGPPGCGKSAMVEHWRAALDEPSFRVALADAADEATMLDRVASALGPSDNVDARVVGHLLRAQGAATVVLDDFDRLVGTGETLIAGWRDAAPLIRWVVTSRQRPDLEDAEVVEVGPMTQAEAIALFEARAREVRPSFQLDGEVRSVVAQLVDELDRIPLAVELAAARINTLGPAQILKRMPERFRILRGRAATLQGAIALSWELLDEWEREVLAQCVVFRGGFGTDAAEAIVELSEDGPWTLDVVEGLVEKSLLRSLAPDDLVGEVRFDVLASVREFVAAERAPGRDLVMRHARFYLEHCRQWTHQMRRRGGAVARARLELEQSNLLAAFAAADEPTLVVDLALTLDKTFRLHGAHATWESVLARAEEHVDEVNASRAALVHRAQGELQLLRGQFDAAAVALERAAETSVRADEHVTHAWTAFLRGELERRRGHPRKALEHLTEAVELARQRSIPNVERMTLGHRAGCLVDVGELDAARDAIEAMRRLTPSEDLRDEANLLKRVAYAQHYLGNHDEQRRLTREALDLARESGDRRLEALCIQGLGDAAFVQRDFDGAREAYVEALALHRAHGSVELEGALLGNLGNLNHRLDRLDEARGYYRQALAIHASTGARPYEAVVWFGLGVLEFEQRHLEDAAAALEHAAALNAEIGNDSDLGSSRLVAGWVAAAMEEDAEPLFAEARATFGRSGDDDWILLCDFDPDAPLPADVDETVRLCAKALRGEAVEDRGRLHVRAALACNARPSVPAPSAVELQLAGDGLWFETSSGRVDLRRRRAPRHILARLIELRGESPGAAIDVYEAFEVGWPNEVATPEAAADRVYWAIRTLRKLGLEPFLVTSGEGYLLDPDAAIAVDD